MFWRLRPRMIASGNSSAVSRTKKMEIPSTPRYQRTPRLVPVYWWLETSWNPPSCTFMVMKARTAMTAVTSEKSSATT